MGPIAPAQSSYLKAQRGPQAPLRSGELPSSSKLRRDMSPRQVTPVESSKRGPQSGIQQGKHFIGQVFIVIVKNMFRLT